MGWFEARVGLQVAPLQGSLSTTWKEVTIVSHCHQVPSFSHFCHSAQMISLTSHNTVLPPHGWEVSTGEDSVSECYSDFIYLLYFKLPLRQHFLFIYFCLTHVICMCLSFSVCYGQTACCTCGVGSVLSYVPVYIMENNFIFPIYRYRKENSSAIFFVIVLYKSYILFFFHLR